MFEFRIRRRQLRTLGWFPDGTPSRHGLLPYYLHKQATCPHYVGLPTGRDSVGGRIVCCLDQELLHFGPIRCVLVVSIPLVYTHEF